MIYDDSTEYGGRGLMPNTVFPKGSDALNAHDKIRLDSITGQTEDSRAPVNIGHWYGNNDFDETKPLHTYKEQARVEQNMEREDKNRYRESPRSFG